MLLFAHSCRQTMQQVYLPVEADVDSLVIKWNLLVRQRNFPVSTRKAEWKLEEGGMFVEFYILHSDIDTKNWGDVSPEEPTPGVSIWKRRVLWWFGWSPIAQVNRLNSENNLTWSSHKPHRGSETATGLKSETGQVDLTQWTVENRTPHPGWFPPHCKHSPVLPKKKKKQKKSCCPLCLFRCFGGLF